MERYLAALESCLTASERDIKLIRCIPVCHEKVPFCDDKAPFVKKLLPRRDKDVPFGDGNFEVFGFLRVFLQRKKKPGMT